MAARWEFLKSNASIQVLVAMWVLRYNLQWPWEGWCHGLRTEDWRYRLMAKNLGLEDSRGVVYWLVVSLLGAHLVPTLLVWFVLAPVAWRFPSKCSSSEVAKVWTGTAERELSLQDALAVLTSLSGIMLQFISAPMRKGLSILFTAKDRTLYLFRLQYLNSKSHSKDRSFGAEWRRSRDHELP